MDDRSSIELIYRAGADEGKDPRPRRRCLYFGNNARGVIPSHPISLTNNTNIDTNTNFNTANATCICQTVLPCVLSPAIYLFGKQSGDSPGVPPGPPRGSIRGLI